MKTEPRSNLDGVDVLLIEDDPLLALGLQRNLVRSGAQVTVAPTLTEARKELDRKPWHVVILDQMLPDGDGMSIIENLDDWPYRPAIVAVSANLQDSYRSLTLQTSDAVLLPKPFSARQLLMAISKALGRRDSELEQLARTPSSFPDTGPYVTALEFGPVSVRLLAQTVTVDGESIDLPPAQFRILATLLANVGRALSVTELANAALRGTHQDGNVNIRFQIHGLRKKLGARGALIETRTGGYGIGVSGTPRIDSRPPEDEAIPDSGPDSGA